MTEAQILDILEKAVDKARREEDKEQKSGAEFSYTLWLGIRLGLQDAIRLIEGHDVPDYLKEISI